MPQCELASGPLKMILKARGERYAILPSGGAGAHGLDESAPMYHRPRTRKTKSRGTLNEHSSLENLEEWRKH